MIKRLFVVCGLLLTTVSIAGPTLEGAGPIVRFPSAVHRVVTQEVHEPGTMMLFGTFLFGVGSAARRLFSARITPRGVSGRDVDPVRDPDVARTPPESVLVGGRDNQGDIRYMPQR